MKCTLQCSTCGQGNISLNSWLVSLSHSLSLFFFFFSHMVFLSLSFTRLPPSFLLFSLSLKLLAFGGIHFGYSYGLGDCTHSFGTKSANFFSFQFFCIVALVKQKFFLGKYKWVNEQNESLLVCIIKILNLLYLFE